MKTKKFTAAFLIGLVFDLFCGLMMAATPGMVPRSDRVNYGTVTHEFWVGMKWGMPVIGMILLFVLAIYLMED